MHILLTVLFTLCWCALSALVCALAGEIAAGFQLLVSALLQLCDIVTVVRSVLRHWLPEPDWREQLLAERRFTIE